MKGREQLVRAALRIAGESDAQVEIANRSCGDRRGEDFLDVVLADGSASGSRRRLHATAQRCRTLASLCQPRIQLRLQERDDVIVDGSASGDLLNAAEVAEGGKGSDDGAGNQENCAQDLAHDVDLRFTQRLTAPRTANTLRCRARFQNQSRYF